MAKKKLLKKPAKTKPVSQPEQDEEPLEEPEQPDSMSTIVDKEIPKVDETLPKETLRANLHMARVKKDRELEAMLLEVLGKKRRTITVEIPVSDLQTDGYGVNINSIPRRVKEFRMSHDAGRAIAQIQLGMLDAGDSNNNGSLVVSREGAVARLLELIGAELDKRSG